MARERRPNPARLLGQPERPLSSPVPLRCTLISDLQPNGRARKGRRGAAGEFKAVTRCTNSITSRHHASRRIQAGRTLGECAPTVGGCVTSAPANKGYIFVRRRSSLMRISRRLSGAPLGRRSARLLRARTAPIGLADELASARSSADIYREHLVGRSQWLLMSANQFPPARPTGELITFALPPARPPIGRPPASITHALAGR